MNQCIGFAPVADAHSRLLILGSMPGVRSLTLRQYYGHPQNRFWPLIAAILNIAEAPAAYEERLCMLLLHRIALWDVLAACERSGSLDSAITAERSNDFVAFFQEHPEIKTVCFNGGKAWQVFRKYHGPLLARQDITYISLPSTSPANAAWRFPLLQEVWGRALASR